MKTCSVQAVRQVVLTDVLIVGRLDVHGQSFAPIGLHKIDAASDWLLIKRVCIGMKSLPGVQLQNYRTTAAIGVILAFTGRKMFYFN
jgi:hypothetical protein